MRRRLVLLAFALDAACGAAGFLLAGSSPGAAAAPPVPVRYVASPSGTCYLLTEVGEAHWRVEGDVDRSYCAAASPAD